MNVLIEISFYLAWFQEKIIFTYLSLCSRHSRWKERILELDEFQEEIAYLLSTYGQSFASLHIKRTIDKRKDMRRTMATRNYQAIVILEVAALQVRVVAECKVNAVHYSRCFIRLKHNLIHFCLVRLMACFYVSVRD